ncbi:unnamed protein product [Coffea canephora]|uniref:DH200=94 genomic scaffold, scaffold_779 n=1 Tax=Coffea canephora TaxID=49390 RepID=A0A068VH58_COFCA|nr:unnamed protein product [Coffea canephora]
MASTEAAYSGASHAQIEPTDADTTPYSTLLFLPSSRRTNSSLSSSPSFSSNSSSAGSLTFPDDNSPFSPPRTPQARFSGVPFSWEQIPGIPKNEISKKEGLSALGLLPLPPAGSFSTNSFRKHNREDMIISPKKFYNPSESFRMDPFFAALVECSKDDHHRHHDGNVIGNLWKGSKVSSKTSLSDRFGFINMYASCKRTCAVSESIVYLPRSRPYSLLNRR